MHRNHDLVITVELAIGEPLEQNADKYQRNQIEKKLPKAMLYLY